MFFNKGATVIVLLLTLFIAASCSPQPEEIAFAPISEKDMSDYSFALEAMRELEMTNKIRAWKRRDMPNAPEWALSPKPKESLLLARVPYKNKTLVIIRSEHPNDCVAGGCETMFYYGEGQDLKLIAKKNFSAPIFKFECEGSNYIAYKFNTGGRTKMSVYQVNSNELKNLHIRLGFETKRICSQLEEYKERY